MPALHSESMHPITLVGAGRLGHAMAAALTRAGAPVNGPLTRGAPIPATGIVVLCVPETAMKALSASISPGAIVGHCSASAPLDDLAPHERFVAHPLLPITRAGANFAGATCAVDANTSRALDAARELATLLGMRPVTVPAERRALYHAAASMAANFLVTLEAAAERLALPCGIDRGALAPLVRASAENFLTLGGKGALTGPVSRGDNVTVARQRAAVAESSPDLLPLWDALVDATRVLAGIA